MSKVIVLDRKFKKLAQLQYDLVIQPVMIEDAATGANTLRFNYPLNADEVIDHTWRIYLNQTWQEVIDNA